MVVMIAAGLDSFDLSLSSLRVSPKLELSSLDILDAEKSFIEQQFYQSSIDQNLVQTSSQSSSIKDISKKIEQNSFENTLTSKIVRVCQAAYLLTWFSDIPVEMGTMCVSKVLQGQVWRVATSAILHNNLLHLLMNMESLKEYGSIVENRWGSRGFVKITACAILAQTAAEMLFGNYLQRSLGISGVIFAFIGALHFKKSKTGIKIDPHFTQFWYSQIQWGLLMKITRLFNVNHKAHLSGYIAGMVFSCLSK